MLLPTIMLLVGMLAQPVCLLYTRSVMRATAAECARAMVSTTDDAQVRAFALRRLAAVPDVAVFHVGGEQGWDVGMERGERSVTVRVTGRARPLPLLGAAMAAFAKRDAEGIVIGVEVSERVRADWVGGDYDDWIAIWE